MKQLSLTVLLLVGFVQAQAQTLILTAPNGGEVFTGGSVQTVSWTYLNVDNIKIEFSLNGGFSWFILTESYPASALNYTWTVPCVGSNQCKVRITSTLELTVLDESDGIFTIPEPTVELIYPNGGESFGTGTGQYIEWATTGVLQLKVQYTSNNGTSWNDIGTFPAGNNYCNWIAPDAPTAQTRIRAWNIESPVNRDSSAAVFSTFQLPASNPGKYLGGPGDGYNMCPNRPDTIRVSTPNGGEVFNPTAIANISWTYRHVDNVKIEYSTNNGSSWNLIVSNIPASQLNYNWTIPNTPSNQCRIKITSLLNGVFDISDAAFTINSAFVNVIYPNGGESFGLGTGQYIEWASNSVNTVKLEYSADNGSSWTLIGTAPAANNYVNWITPAPITSQCLIRITDNDNAALSDISDAAFNLFTLLEDNPVKYLGGPNDGYSMNSTLPDSIHLTSPNGGEIWNAASTRTITWTYNEIDNVKIEFTLDDGVSWSVLAASIPASQLSYAWTIPTTPSNTCRVRISSLSVPVSDESDAFFEIPNSSVQILYPNGGEQFGVGTGQYIEWDYTDLATIKLEYTTDNGATWNLIGTAPASHKYANWVVPAVPSNQFRIRATATDNPIFTDQSNAVFSGSDMPIESPTKYHGGEFDGYSMYVFIDTAEVDPVLCDASFYTSTTALTGYFIPYGNNISSNPSAGIFTYEWEFGNGATSSAVYPFNVYSQPGLYNVCLRVTNDGFCADTVCQDVFIPEFNTIPEDTSCIAYFVITQQSPFEVTIVNVSNILNATFNWTLTGSGLTIPFEGPYPSLAVDTVGDFNLCLDISTETCTSSFCDSLIIGGDGILGGRLNELGFIINVVSPQEMTGFVVTQIGEVDLDVSIFPNPIEEFIYLELQPNQAAGTYRIELIDATGRSVFRNEIQLREGSTRINLPDLASGTYVLMLNNANYSGVKRLVK
jgi:hypothetical protein